ncbi:hypothetical protein HZA75_07640 [Candidatus Roizmanbacteria bacterium]|nr:hypothetical protein [Candidatus Roizmanbacteria bacterium]
MIERIRNLNNRLSSYNKLPDKTDIDRLPLHVIKRHSYYDSKHFVVLGVHHRTEPLDAQFKSIKKEFRAWLKKTEGTKRMLIVEGRIPVSSDDEDSSIRTERGEAGLLAFWAKEYTIPIISGEPQPQWSEANDVARLFDKDEEVRSKDVTGKEITAYYYLARHISQWHRIPQGKRGDINTYIKQTINLYLQAWQWHDFEFFYEDFLRVHEKLYNSQLDLMDNNFFLEQTVNFKQGKTPVQRVAQAVNDLRDKNLANLYAKYWNRNISVFSLFGMPHTLRIAGILNTFGLTDD